MEQLQMSYVVSPENTDAGYPSVKNQSGRAQKRPLNLNPVLLSTGPYAVICLPFVSMLIIAIRLGIVNKKTGVYPGK